MEVNMWDAGQYLRFGGERARPFFDLVAQIGTTSPRHVVDLGCGPGNLTAALAQRWPAATVTGLDSSPEMIDAARASALQNPAGHDSAVHDSAGHDSAVHDSAGQNPAGPAVR